MTSIVDWNIDDSIDFHQRKKKERILAIAEILRQKGQVSYEQFLSDMQLNGIRKSVAEEYLDALKNSRIIRVVKGNIIWNIENDTASCD